MSNKCKPCSDTYFQIVSSDPRIADLLQSKVEVVGDGEFIDVEKTVVDGVTRFTVSYSPYIALVIESFTNNIPLQLKGNTVSDLTLSWSYNKEVVSQSLNQGLTAPAVSNVKTYSLPITGQNITDDFTIQLTADDVVDDDNNPKTAQTTIQFGNYIYQTQIAIADRSLIDNTLINGIDLTQIDRTLRRTRGITFTSDSISGEYEAIFVPASFNVNSGTQFVNTATNFTGGWGKILTLPLTNDAGFTEDYDIWVSSNRFLAGQTFKIN